MACNRTIIVLDGHDGAGKTTLAKRLAQNLDASYVTPYSGETGKIFYNAAVYENNIELANNTAKESIAKILDKNKSRYIVFDRHWMTACTVLPQNFWNKWQPIPLTILCYSEIETTLERLKKRGEKISNVDEHIYYIELYEKLAKHFGCFILRTDQNNTNKNFDILLNYVKEATT